MNFKTILKKYAFVKNKYLKGKMLKGNELWRPAFVNKHMMAE